MRKEEVLAILEVAVLVILMIVVLVVMKAMVAGGNGDSIDNGVGRVAMEEEMVLIIVASMAQKMHSAQGNGEKYFLYFFFL